MSAHPIIIHSAFDNGKVGVGVFWAVGWDKWESAGAGALVPG